MLALDDNLAAPWLLELWQHAPTPAKGARLHKQTVARLLKTHRIRRLDADQVRSILQEPPLPSAPGVTEAATGHIRLLLPRACPPAPTARSRWCTPRSTRSAEQLAGPQTIEQGENVPGQSTEQRDVTILHSVPGIGRIVGATLLAEASAPLRRRDYHAIRTLAGQAPVTKRSGKSCFVHRRLACNKRLAYAMYHWARVAVVCDPPGASSATPHCAPAVASPWQDVAQRGRPATEAAVHAAAASGVVRSQPQREAGCRRVSQAVHAMT